MKKLLIILATALVFALAVSGCTDKEEKKIENITRTEEKQEPEVKEEVSEKEEKETETEPLDEKEDETSEETVSKPTASLLQILSEIKTAVGAEGAMDLDASAISSLYGIDESDIKDAAGFVVMAGTFPHEVVMVEARDEAAAQRAENFLKVKHSSFVEQSKGYDAQNYALAQKCKVERKGNRISMFLSPDYEIMNSVYGKYN